MKIFIFCIVLICCLVTELVAGYPASIDRSPYGNWTEITDNAGFGPRDFSGISAFNDQIWVIGGRGASFLNDVWSTPDGKNWTLVTDNAGFSPRVSPGVVSFNNSLWVIGGAREDTVWNDVWSSQDGKNWILVTDNASFGPRSDAGIGVFDDRLWVIGGYSGALLNDVWSSQDGKNWELITGNASFSPRYGHSVVSFDNRLWVIGGARNNDVWSSEDGKNWTLINASAPFRQMEFTPVTVFANKLWIVGGGSNPPTHQTRNPISSDYNEVWSSEDGNTWKLVAEHAGFSPRFQHGLVVFHDGIWVIGGSGSNGQDVWRMSPIPNSYHEINSSLQTTLPSPNETNSTVPLPTTQPAPLPGWISVVALGSLFTSVGIIRKIKDYME